VDNLIFICNACGFKLCIVHDAVWHDGETCNEYDYRISGQKEKDEAAKERADRAAEEEASRVEVEKSTKKCPGAGCTWNIQKNDGCNHMTCLKCRYEFCWVCLADYNSIRRKGNSAHKKHCTDYR
jgi:hypothetical protein